MKQQRGATLIEVLISLLILKIGILGALAGQLLALKWVTDATQRTTAVALSHEILQQLQAFNAVAAAPDFTLTGPITAPDCLAGLPCNALDARQALLARWQQKWQATETNYGFLLAPSFCVQQHNGQLQLAVSWRQHAANDQAEYASCQLSAGRSGLQLGRE